MRHKLPMTFAAMAAVVASIGVASPSSGLTAPPGLGTDRFVAVEAGTVVSGCASGTQVVSFRRDGTERQALLAANCGDSSMPDIRLASDRRRLLTRNSGGGVGVHDVVTGANLGTPGINCTRGVAWIGDHTRYACMNDGWVRVFDATSSTGTQDRKSVV